MYYVYVLRSLKDRSSYIGSTSDLRKRIKQHNSGKSRYTNQHKPYELVCYIALPLGSDAERFEEYLKSGYGRRTLKKMLRDYLKKEKSPANDCQILLLDPTSLRCSSELRGVCAPTNTGA